MKHVILGLTAAAALGLGTQAFAAGSERPRTDTSVKANSTEPVAQAPLDGPYSNWPALPERQAGRSYSQLVHTTSGVRERNFESGR